MDKDLEDIFERIIIILSHELMLRSNDSDTNWVKGAYQKAVFEKFMEEKENGTNNNDNR